MPNQNEAHLSAIRSLLPELSANDEEGILDILQDCINTNDAANEICELVKIPRRANRYKIADALKASGYC